MLECQITKPLNRQESATVQIEYDVRKILAGTPIIAWKNIYVQSNSQSAIDEDRTNDNGKNSIHIDKAETFVVPLIEFYYALNDFVF